MQSYVTYNNTTGELTGGYLQELPEDVGHYFLVDAEERINWPLYEMSENRDAIVLKPVVIPEPQVIVPQIVTRRQARQALLIRGLLDLVGPAIDSIEDPLHRGLAQIEWEDATEFERNRELVIQIGLALGLEDEGLDELFIFAATL